MLLGFHMNSGLKVNVISGTVLSEGKVYAEYDKHVCVTIYSVCGVDWRSAVHLPRPTDYGDIEKTNVESAQRAHSPNRYASMNPIL